MIDLDFTLNFKNYEAKDCFDAAKTGMFFLCFLDKALTFKGNHCSGGKVERAYNDDGRLQYGWVREITDVCYRQVSEFSLF